MAAKTMKFAVRTLQPGNWELLYQAIRNDRIGQAYLFSGPEGSGKETTALEFGRMMNCHDPSNPDCTACSSCQRFKSFQHEHLHLVVPMPVSRKKSQGESGGETGDMDLLSGEMEKKVADPFHKIRLPRATRILIASIRALRKKLYLKSVDRGRKVVLIFDAHLLTFGQGEAANALLKILEEPPPDTTMILVTDHKSKLFPTLISRCQQVNFPPLPRETVANVLQEQGLKEPEALFFSSLAQGNLHQARLLSELAPEDLKKHFLSLVQVFQDQEAAGIRDFITTLGRAGFSDRDQYRFNLTLLQLWFKSSYACRIQNYDDLYEAGFARALESFNHRFPAANYRRINRELEYAVSAPERNQYLPLVLINTVIKISKALNNENYP